jgi:hypothetical protein
VAENDELRAAEARLRLHNESQPWEGRSSSPYAIVGDPSGRVLDVLKLHRDQGLLADAYLAHPPLTRERVAAAVGELFTTRNGASSGRVMELLRDDRLTIRQFTPSVMTDELCRLLGVEGE